MQIKYHKNKTIYCVFPPWNKVNTAVCMQMFEELGQETQQHLSVPPLQVYMCGGFEPPLWLWNLMSNKVEKKQ